MEQHLIKLLITIVDRGKGRQKLLRFIGLSISILIISAWDLAQPTAKSWTILG